MRIRLHKPTTNNMSKKESHIIEMFDQKLLITGRYSPETANTSDTPGTSASFEISEIEYKGVSVYELLGGIGSIIEQAEIIILNKHYNHNYSL